MTLNYTCLGSNDKIRQRRYNVLSFYLRGGTPDEIFTLINKTEKLPPITLKQVYNDVQFLRSTSLHDLPVDMVRDFGKSFYEIKVSELERKLSKNESNPAVWLGIQKLIREYKGDSLKLQGLMSEKVELNVPGISKIEITTVTRDDNKTPI